MCSQPLVSASAPETRRTETLPMQGIDRFASAVGLRWLVAGKPGMGWLIFEMAPVMVWGRLSGAMTLESFYLVSYLTLLGANDALLAILPMLGFGGMMVHALPLLRQNAGRGRDAKAACLRSTGIGRGLWLLALLWPMTLVLVLPQAWYAPLTGDPSDGLGPWTVVVIGGMLGLLFLAQVQLWTGVSWFATWTQTVMPLQRRGTIHAVRNIISFLATVGALLIVSAVMPTGGRAAAPEATFWTLTVIFLVTTGIVLAFMWPLSWSPDMDATIRAKPPPSEPLGSVLRRHGHLRRLLLFGLLSSGANLTGMTFLFKAIQDVAVTEETWAHWEALAFAPMMLTGFVLGGLSYGRLGGARLLPITQALMVGTFVLALLTSAANAWVMVPIVAAALGFSRSTVGLVSFTRMQELVEPGDHRQPALFFSAMGLGCVLVAVGALAAVMLLDGTWGLTGAQWVLAGVAGLGGVAVIVAALPQPPHTPYDPDAPVDPPVEPPVTDVPGM